MVVSNSGENKFKIHLTVIIRIIIIPFDLIKLRSLRCSGQLVLAVDTIVPYFDDSLLEELLLGRDCSESWLNVKLLGPEVR